MTASMPDTTLEAIRQEIDSIDGQILRLLMQRFAATERVRATKAHDGTIAASPFRPAREAVMMRRLMVESGSALSPELLVRLWRVILSASIQSQAPVTLHVDGGLGRDLETRVLIAQHFCGMKLEFHDGASRALKALDTLQGDLALMAPGSPWSEGYLPSPGAPKVIGTLPALANGGTPQLLIFGHAQPQPSGDDETLLMLPVSADTVSGCLWRATSGSRLLVAIQGFLTDDSSHLRDVLNRHPGALIVGRYPRPIKVSP